MGINGWVHRFLTCGMKHLKRSGLDCLALVIITVSAVIYFWKPLTGNLVVMTPDYGRSDAWHFSFATRYTYGEALRDNRVPIWESDVGGGFPFFAEGQTGMLYLPNLITYRVFPPVIAYNVSFITTIGLLGTGMFWFLRLYAIGVFPALLAALAFMLSGLTQTELPHITLLQGFSLMPVTLAVVTKLARRPSVTWMSVIAFILSQQILTGYPQAVFITVLVAVPYLAMTARGAKEGKRTVFMLITALVLALGLGAVQLIPSREFQTQIQTAEGYDPKDAAWFSYPFSHLNQFFLPFANGNPKYGTYPHQNLLAGNIFWETSGYFGIIAVVIAIIGYLVHPNVRKHALTIVAVAGLAGSFLLMTGKYSPFYIVYSFWPFTLFRVPARFIWVFVMSGASLFAVSFDQFWKSNREWRLRRFILLAAGIGNILIVLLSYHGYELFLPADELLSEPASTAYVEPGTRIIALAPEKAHNAEFLNYGWTRPETYLFLRNYLDPNSNLLWGIPHQQVYAGRMLRRPSFLQNMLSDSFRTGEKEATASTASANLLAMTRVGTVFSPLTINNSTLRPIATEAGGHHAIRVYRNDRTVPPAYFVTELKPVKNLPDAVRTVGSPEFNPVREALTTGEARSFSEAGHATVEIITDKDTDLHIRLANVEHESYLVVPRTFYPGWNLEIDGSPSDIEIVNIAYMGFRIPAGSQSVLLRYRPLSFLTGALVSIATGGVLILVFAGSRLRNNAHSSGR